MSDRIECRSISPRTEDSPRHAPEPLLRTALIATLLPLCWLAMQVVHELGHVAAAWATGGEVTAVVLHPLEISRTDVSPNPRPGAVVWGGPLIGSLLPTIVWLSIAARKLPFAYLWRFFAGFCLIANGAYIGSGAIDPVGDAADLARLGTPPWTLAAFGLVTVPAGLALWHGQAAAFGFGRNARPVPRSHVLATLTLLAALVVAELLSSALTGFA